MSTEKSVSIRLSKDDLKSLEIVNDYVKKVTLSDTGTSELFKICLRWFADSVINGRFLEE